MEVRILREQIDRERGARTRPRRYSAAIRAQVVEHVRSHRVVGGRLTSLAQALGLSRCTVATWVRNSHRPGGAFHRVEVQAPPAQATLVAPGGFRLEGDAASVAAVLRALAS